MDYRTRRLVNGVIIVCLLAIAVTLAIGLLASKEKGVEFTVVFEDAKELPVGAPVTLRGLRVGEVTAVALSEDKTHVDVKLAVVPAYAPEVPGPGGVTARIKKSFLLPGNHSVALIKLKDATGRMKDGSRIDGVDNWAEEKTFLARGKIQKAYDAAVTKTTEKIDQFKTWWGERGDRKERAALREKLLTWLDDWENLDATATEASLKALRLQAKLLAEELRKEGMETEAAQLEDIAASIEEVEKADREQEPVL